MARYTMTMVFESGDADDAHGPEVLARLALPDHAVHRSSWCDGTTLTVVVDFRSSHPAAVCRFTVDAVRAAWARASSADLGDPISVRVRPLRPPHPVPDGAGRPREYRWQPDPAGGDGQLVLIDPGSDPFSSANGPWEDERVSHVPAEHGHRRRAPGLGPLRIALPILPRRRRD